MGVILNLCIDDEITALRKSGEFKIDYFYITDITKQEYEKIHTYCIENNVNKFINFIQTIVRNTVNAKSYFRKGKTSFI